MSGENLTRENKVRGELVSPDLREVWRAEGEIVKERRVDARSLAWQGNLLRNVNVVLRARWGLEKLIIRISTIGAIFLEHEFVDRYQGVQVDTLTLI